MQIGCVSQSKPPRSKWKWHLLVNITEHRTQKDEVLYMHHNKSRLLPFLPDQTLLLMQRAILPFWYQYEQTEEDIWPFVLFPTCRMLQEKKNKEKNQAGRNSDHLKYLFVAIWKIFWEKTTNYSWTPNPNPEQLLGRRQTMPFRGKSLSDAILLGTSL